MATIVLAIGATLLTVSVVGPTYSATGAVLLVPPGATLEQRPGTTTTPGNPYLELSGLGEARDIVIRSMSAKSTYIELCQASGDARYESMRRGLCGAHPSVSFEISPDYESSAPVILVTAEAASQQDAITTLTTIMSRVPATLQELQGGLSLRPKAAITSTTLVADTLPDVVHKDQIRAAVLAGGGALALGILVTGMVDGIFLPRRRAAADGVDTDETDAVPESDGRGPGADEDATAEEPVSDDPVSDDPASDDPASDDPGTQASRRRHKPAKQAPAVPEWGTPTEQELAGVGADRSVPHWE